MKSALLSLAVALTSAACASTGVWLEADTKNYKERLETKTEGSLRVSTSVLSTSESLAIYGVPLSRKGIQPVWIEVENNDDRAYWLLHSGVDPHYFPATEAADAFAPSDSSNKNQELDVKFRQLGFKNSVHGEFRVCTTKPAIFQIL
jgi:hypothetical protein